MNSSYIFICLILSQKKFHCNILHIWAQTYVGHWGTSDIHNVSKSWFFFHLQVTSCHWLWLLYWQILSCSYPCTNITISNKYWQYVSGVSLSHRTGIILRLLYYLLLFNMLYQIPMLPLFLLLPYHPPKFLVLHIHIPLLLLPYHLPSFLPCVLCGSEQQVSTSWPFTPQGTSILLFNNMFGIKILPGTTSAWWLQASWH